MTRKISAALIAGLLMLVLCSCGKTGTAEVGDGQEPHAWFMGFSKSEDCPLAIVVVIENGGWGASNAIPVASSVMRAAYKVTAAD